MKTVATLHHRPPLPWKEAVTPAGKCKISFFRNDFPPSFLLQMASRPASRIHQPLVCLASFSSSLSFSGYAMKSDLFHP